MKTIKNFSELLLQWYAVSARKLPWRKTRDPYKIWISEIMLQQTTVKAVIPYYERWIKQFPDIKSLVKTQEQDVLRMWQGLGYYSRVRNIIKAAKVISSEHKGKIPSGREALRSLPGFGPYTTGAVLSIAFNQREPIVDANVRRVIMRILGIKGKADISQDKIIYSFLEKNMPYKNLSDFNQALMELGALICRSKDPLCLQCPLKKSCAAYKKGIQEIIPEPKISVVKTMDVAIAVIQKGKKFYLQKRSEKGLLAGLWEFPGGKIEKGESDKEAMIREVKEELDVDVDKAKFFLKTIHYYTQFRVNLHVWLVTVKQVLKEDKSHKWLLLNEIDDYPLPSGSVKIVEKLYEIYT